MTSVKKLTIAAVVIAIYVSVMYLTQSFAFGQYQIRIATSLYAFSYIYPFLIIPLGIANFISNAIMGGLGPLDMIGGTVVGIVTSGTVYLIRRFNLNKWFIVLPIVLGPGLMVPIWLSYLLDVPYKILALSICIGQITPAIVGVLLIQYMEKFFKMQIGSELL